MQGHFDIFVQDAKGLRDEDFLRAEREGRLRDLVKSLPIDQEAHTDNLVLDMYPICMMRRVIGHGFPSGPYPMERGTGIPFYSICLLSLATEPEYIEWYSGYWSLHNMSYTVNSVNAGKRFVVHDMDLLVDVEPTGREGIFIKERWLYLPSQAVSNEIRSVGAYWCENITDGNDERGQLARVRMKDAGGNPITLNKSASQTLLIQYTFTLVSL